jgi:ComF family protein
MNGLNRTLTELLNLLFPPVCINCHERIAEQSMWLCGNCFDRLSPLPEEHCPKCGYPTEGNECSNCAVNSYVFSRAGAVFLYDGPAKALVQALKYDGKRRIAEWFAAQMHKLLLQDKTLTDVDVITAVPLHRVRRRERGYNQSDLIARALAARLGKPYAEKALRRTVYTASQTKLGGASRRKNLQDAFRAGRFEHSGKSFLLIDDVFTTGTTVNEASRALLRAGAKEVFVLTACHGL